MRKFLTLVRDDKEWQVIAGLIAMLTIACALAVVFGGMTHALTLALGVVLGCIVQAVMLELQKRD
jgi:hypothetical protein